MIGIARVGLYLIPKTNMQICVCTQRLSCRFEYFRLYMDCTCGLQYACMYIAMFVRHCCMEPRRAELGERHYCSRCTYVPRCLYQSTQRSARDNFGERFPLPYLIWHYALTLLYTHVPRTPYLILNVDLWHRTECMQQVCTVNSNSRSSGGSSTYM